MTSVDVYRERELKLEVPDGFEVPEVEAILAGTTVERRTVALSSTYYDTVDLDLLGHRVTLRRRTGDTDNGWHLKIPAGDARDEITAPLDDGVTSGTEVDHEVPAELAELLTGIVRPTELTTIARLDTERRLTRVYREDALVVEIADDRVAATSGGGDRHWREVEIELGPAGSEQDLGDIAARVRRAGARSSASTSKVARALGHESRDVSRSPAGELVAAYLATAHRGLVAGDIAMRRGDLTAARASRIAARRVRSVLRVFRDVLGSDGGATARALDAELNWFQDLLGSVRDQQAQRERFDSAMALLPAELVLGPVTTRLDQTLSTDTAAAFATVTAALATNRYRRMLASVATLGAGDPVAPGTTRTILRTSAEKASRTAARRLRRAQGTGDPAQLHHARKAVMRARYAAELVGRSAKTIRRFERVQDVLGEHRDALVAADTARRVGAVAGTQPGENGFTFGLLHQRELDRARTLRREAQHLRVPR